MHSLAVRSQQAVSIAFEGGDREHAIEHAPDSEDVVCVVCAGCCKQCQYEPWHISKISGTTGTFLSPHQFGLAGESQSPGSAVRSACCKLSVVQQP